MKKFLLLLVSIVLTGSLFLHFSFRYSGERIFYHLIVMMAIITGIGILNLILFRIFRRWQQKWPIHLLNYLILLFFIIFYLAICGSNSLWGRAIPSGLLISYIASIADFVQVLPVKSYLVYTAIALLFLVTGVIYYFVAPKKPTLISAYRISKKFLSLNRKKQLGIIAVCLALVATASIPLIQFKRLIHFRGEPVMEFVFGQMWESHGDETVFGKNMAIKNLADKPCIEAVDSDAELRDGRVVVVILFDALRSDFLPAYGYSRPTTPFFDSLQNTGNLAVVKNAFSTSTTTLLGVAGLFGSKDWNTFSFGGLNLMKFMKIKGFKTYAFLTGQHRSWYGLTNIYHNDCDFFYESTTKPAEQNFDDFTTLKKINETKIQPNSFVYIHLLSTHNIGIKHDQFRKYQPDKMGFSGNKKEVLINNYDNGILQGDFVVSRIFSKLKNEGLLDKATIYIVSDHAELFGEDGRWSHSGNVYPTLLNIPLMVYDQKIEWYKNVETATIKDVAPSIAARLGYSIPDCWEGKSLGERATDFSMKVHAGSDCDFPEGILTRKDSIIEMEIMDRQLKPARRFLRTNSSAEWVEQKNEN